MATITKDTIRFEDRSKMQNLLKDEVQEIFGRRVVTSGDCIHLSDEVFGKTNFTLNPNTLRRFFGLVKADYPPSTSTINILAKYCGFQSTEDIKKLKESNNDKSLQEDDLSILIYFINLFKETPAKDINDETFYTFVSHTINFLQKKPELADKFQRGVVKTLNGQRFYFEQFVNVDKLNSFYGTGLRYYINEKRTPEGQIFGYALLCARDWLIADNNALKKNFDYMRQQYLLPNASPLSSGRFFAASLYHADVFEQSTQQVINEAYKVHAGMKQVKNSCHLYNCFEYPFAVALLLTQHYEEALYYINYALATHTVYDGYLYQGCYQKMLLSKAIALLRMQPGSLNKVDVREDAEKIYSNLRPSQFYFLSKKTDTILYLLLEACLKKGNGKHEKMLEELIDETGFKKLKSLMEK